MTTLEIDRHGVSSFEPTAEAPEIGEVGLTVNGEFKVVSVVEWWHEDARYIVRSRDFDCAAQAATRDEAFHAFVENVFGYARQLGNRVKHSSATDAEREIFEKLQDRLFFLMLDERERGRARRRPTLLDRLTGGPTTSGGIVVR